MTANWQNSGYCVAVWSVIYPHFLPFFLPESVGHARVVQHRIKSIFGFDSVVALFSGFWRKIIRKIIFQFEYHNFFSKEKSCQKRTCITHSANGRKIQGPAMRLNFFAQSFRWILRARILTKETNEKTLISFLKS